MGTRYSYSYTATQRAVRVNALLLITCWGWTTVLLPRENVKNRSDQIQNVWHSKLFYSSMSGACCRNTDGLVLLVYAVYSFLATRVSHTNTLTCGPLGAVDPPALFWGLRYSKEYSCCYSIDICFSFTWKHEVRSQHWKQKSLYSVHFSLDMFLSNCKVTFYVLLLHTLRICQKSQFCCQWYASTSLL